MQKQIFFSFVLVMMLLGKVKAQLLMAMGRDLKHQALR